MTLEQLAEIKAQIPHGYPPPWKVEPWYEDGVLQGWNVLHAEATENSGLVLTAPDYGLNIADWAVAAREHIPALVAEVERLTACVADMAEDSQLLAALQAAGVDNWDGYSVAHEILDDWNRPEVAD